MNIQKKNGKTHRTVQDTQRTQRKENANPSTVWQTPKKQHAQHVKDQEPEKCPENKESLHAMKINWERKKNSQEQGQRSHNTCECRREKSTTGSQQRTPWKTLQTSSHKRVDTAMHSICSTHHKQNAFQSVKRKREKNAMQESWKSISSLATHHTRPVHKKMLHAIKKNQAAFDIIKQN